MKNLEDEPFPRLRDHSPRTMRFYGGVGDETCGAFNVYVPETSAVVHVIASQGMGWDHVSVSRPSRCPTWEEMAYVKRLFFKEDEWAIEYHPPVHKNINAFKFCLHLWRPTNGDMIPVPPEIMIA